MILVGQPHCAPHRHPPSRGARQAALQHTVLLDKVLFGGVSEVLLKYSWIYMFYGGLLIYLMLFIFGLAPYFYATVLPGGVHSALRAWVRLASWVPSRSGGPTLRVPPGGPPLGGHLGSYRCCRGVIG